MLFDSRLALVFKYTTTVPRRKDLINQNDYSLQTR